MNKDGLTLRSHELKGYAVLKWRVQYFYFSIRLMCLVRQKVSIDFTKTVLRKVARSTPDVKNGVFLDVTPCGSCKNRRFGGT
jgi:hypothetical protein